MSPNWVDRISQLRTPPAQAAAGAEKVSACRRYDGSFNFIGSIFLGSDR